MQILLLRHQPTSIWKISKENGSNRLNTQLWINTRLITALKYFELKKVVITCKFEAIHV